MPHNSIAMVRLNALNYLLLSPTPPLLGDPLDILRGDLLLTAGGAMASAADVAS